MQAIRKIENRPAIEIAKRQLQKCGEIFHYAIATGRAVRDPSSDIKDALKPQKTTHYAALDVKELPDSYMFWTRMMRDYTAALYRALTPQTYHRNNFHCAGGMLNGGKC